MTSPRLSARGAAYTSEAATLGLFMIAAAVATVILEHPASPIRAAIVASDLRRALMGVVMGATAAGLIYSPLGRLSGPHMNPAVTLTYLRLGKIGARDAGAYVAAQFAGALAGLAMAQAMLGSSLGHPAVNYVATLPGTTGPAVAFAAEWGISLLMMLAVLTFSNHARLARWTGLVAATLVAIFITVEAPLSGMSMNPARSFGPGLMSGVWAHQWIYFVAPPFGMLTASALFVLARGQHAVLCAKLHHDHRHCFFGCEHREQASTPTNPARPSAQTATA